MVRSPGLPRQSDLGRPEVRYALIRGLDQAGLTIRLTPQYLEEADQLAARITVIHHGRKIAEGTSGELKALASPTWR